MLWFSVHFFHRKVLLTPLSGQWFYFREKVFNTLSKFSISCFITLLLPIRHSLPRLRLRSKSPLIRPSQTSGISDQTVPDRSDLWSDECALEDHCALEVRSKPPLIRRVPDRSDPWSDKFQTIVQTSSRPLSRLKCVQNSLIREWFWRWTNLSISL